MSHKTIAALSIAMVVLVSLVASQYAVSQDKKQTFPRTKSPAGAESYIISPLDGETVGQTFTVRFGLRGMGVAPAGINISNTGHHHLLINHDHKVYDQPLPATDHCKHFGGGQTETVLTLPPGKHTLQLILGDHLHVPHDPPVVSKKITVHVK